MKRNYEGNLVYNITSNLVVILEYVNSKVRIYSSLLIETLKVHMNILILNAV